MKNFLDVVAWYQDEFKNSSLFQNMTATVENSPWHREANVGVHTDMVVQEYIARCVDANDTGDSSTRGLWACIFHDVGKPKARTEKFSEARGVYFSYPGHEQISARLFEDFAASNLTEDMTAEDMYKIGLMIDQHLPYDIAKTEKKRRLALTARFVGAQTFVRVLLSDAYGRISDDSAEKRAKTELWVTTFLALVAVTPEVAIPVDNKSPVMYVPVGPSGCGKSTCFTALCEGPYPMPMNVFSLDLLRHEFYDVDDYSNAYQCSVDDTTFKARSQQRFMDMVKERKKLYIDNTNLSAKRRNFYIDTARRMGYMVIAIVMPSSLAVVCDRQLTRGDKNVPESAVRQQYNSLQLPLYGEFDSVVVLGHNL